MISSLYQQWIEGLSEAVICADSYLRPRKSFRLRRDTKLFKLFRVEHDVEELAFSSSPNELEAIPAKVLQDTRGCVIEIMVPPAAIVERRLDPLPGESFPFLENVVLHQVDSIFPWRSSDVLFSAKVDKRTNGMLDVTVQATPRSAIGFELAAADAFKAAEIIITAEGRDQPGVARPRIQTPVGSASENKLKHSRMVARYAIAAVLGLSVFVMGWTSYVQWSLSSDVAALDQLISERRALIERNQRALGSNQGGLEARKKRVATAVGVMEELSSILPDGTYLTDLNMEAGRVRITGVSSNAVELIPLLEKSGQFKNVSFYAPTTRLSGGTSDRFSIEANLAPSSSP